MATAVAMAIRTLGILLLAASGLAAIPETVRAPEPSSPRPVFTYRSSWTVLLDRASGPGVGDVAPVRASWSGERPPAKLRGGPGPGSGDRDAHPTHSTFVPPPAPDDLGPVQRRLLTLRTPGWIPGLPDDPSAIELIRPRGFRTPPIDGISAYLEVRVEGERGVNAGVSVDF